MSHKTFTVGPFELLLTRNPMAPFLSFTVWRGDKRFVEVVEFTVFHCSAVLSWRKK